MARSRDGLRGSGSFFVGADALASSGVLTPWGLTAFDQEGYFNT